MGVLLEIPLGEIRENKIALRSVNTKSEIFLGIVDSIRAVGVLNPIVVKKREGDDGYTLVDGLQRFTASIEAGRETIPAQVITADAQQTLEAQLMANVHRVEMRAVDYTKQLQRILSNNPLLTAAELSSNLGKSASWVSERLGLLKLTDKAQKLVNNGDINLTNAYTLAKFTDPEEQDNWLDRAMNQPPDAFAPEAKARQKEIRDAKRAGKEPGKAKFIAVQKLRKLIEIKAQAESPTVLTHLIDVNGITDPLAAAQITIDWVLEMDPETIAAKNQKWDETQAEKERLKKEKAEERKSKKEAENLEKATD